MFKKWAQARRDRRLRNAAMEAYSVRADLDALETNFFLFAAKQDLDARSVPSDEEWGRQWAGDRTGSCSTPSTHTPRACGRW
jgi:hypothetical protein